MAELHNALRRAKGLLRGIKDMVGMQDAESGVERLGETLTPTIDPWARPEWAFLRDELLWAVQANAALFAGEFPVTAVSNPVGSNQIVVVEMVKARASPLIVGLTTRAQVAASLAAGNGGTARDSRNPPIPPAAVRVESWAGTDVANPFQTGLEELFGLAEYLEARSTPYILAPGHALFVQGLTVSTSLQSAFAGRVRAALPGELV